jgi:glycosyltransferase involved in cell wall biosynthesis
MGSRVLLHPHCSLAFLYTERPGWWQWLFRRIIKLTNGVVALSSEWLQLRSIVPTCRVYYLPNAIDLAPYRLIAQERLAHVKCNGSLRILYLGYLGRAKGSFDLVEAARLALSDGENLSFDLVGDELTPGEGRLVREFVDNAQLNGNVRVHPPAQGAGKLAFFRNADAFVYPSYYEGMPMAVLEAMACGLPIVATSVGGLPDLVQDSVNGILVAPRRPEQLAAALHKLASDSPLRQAMQMKSYQFASEQYDMEKHVAQLVDIYRAALSY